MSILNAWCQCAVLLSLVELAHAGDHIVGGRYPQKTLEQLRSAVDSRAGARGVGGLKEALEWVRPGSESPKETELRLLLVRSGLPEPELNGDVYGPDGTFIGRGDLLYRGFKVLVEDDWRVVRVLKEHMNGDRADIVTRVRNALLAKGWRP